VPTLLTVVNRAKDANGANRANTAIYIHYIYIYICSTCHRLASELSLSCRFVLAPSGTCHRVASELSVPVIALALSPRL